MKFFIDTANVEEIRELATMGILAGVTTNPSLIAKEGRDYRETLLEISSIVDGPISGEVKPSTLDAQGMIQEGREIAAMHPNMVVKIPMTDEGLKAVRVLASEGIKTNDFISSSLDARKNFSNKPSLYAIRFQHDICFFLHSFSPYSLI